MNYDKLHATWPAIKNKIQKEYPNISDDELLLKIGQEEELLLSLQAKLGKNRKEIDKWLSLMG